MDKDEKLLVFLDSLGPDADVDTARQMLEACDWNLEAALNMVTGGDTASPGPRPTSGLREDELPPDYVDEDGYRAPMRTGYEDRLMGPDPQEMVFEQAAAHAGGHHAFGRDDEAIANLDAVGADRGDGRRRSGQSDSVRQAMRASQAEYQRLSDQQEQGAIANALQASYADYTATEQQRLQQGFQDESEEQRLMAQAIEASFKEQTNADAQYRAQLERALKVSTGQDTASMPSGRSSPTGASGRTSPTAANSAGGSRFAAAAAPRPSASAVARNRVGSVGATLEMPASRTPGLAEAATAFGPVAEQTARRSSNERADTFSSRRGEIPVELEPSSGAARTSLSSQAGALSAASRRAAAASGEQLPGGQPRHAADVRANAAALSSAVHARPRLSRGSSGSSPSNAGGEVPAALAVNGRLTGAQRLVSGRPMDEASPASRASGAGRMSDALASRAAAIPSRGIGSGGSGASSASTGARVERRDPAAGVGPNSALGAAARGPGTREPRPTAPGMPIPTAPLPPSAGSRSSAGTPPNVSLRHGVEEPDHVPKAAREPRSGLTPLNAARAPGQDAAVRSLRDAAEADQRRYPMEEERQKREATREVEDQRQRRESESRQLEADRRRREQEVANAEQKMRALEAAAAEKAAEKLRRQEAEQRRQNDEEDERRQKDEERKQNDEEQKRQRLEEAKRRRLAETEAAAAASTEAERKQSEAEEFEIQRQAAEVETRRREAKEAEELAKERKEAEDRQREAERGANPEAKDKEASDLVTALVSMRKRYKEDPEGLATCLKTLGTYIRNLANNPHEQKFQRINTENANFQKRVAVYEGSTAVLLACGFRDEGPTLVVDAEFLKSKGPRLFDAVTKIDVLVGQLTK